MSSAKIYYGLYHFARIVAALILLQTLFHKFGGSAESVALFTELGSHTWSRFLSLGGEPTGRILSGITELIAGVLLLIPRTAWVGALASSGMMVIAMLFHITLLGINFLFGMAVLVFVASLYVLWYKRGIMIDYSKKALSLIKQ